MEDTSVIVSKLGGLRRRIINARRRLFASLPSASKTLKGFLLHGTLYSTMIAVLVTLVVGIKQWNEKPIAIGPFTVVSGADTYGITAEALSDQLKGKISLINSESGELFESRKLVDNALPLDIKLGNTGWTFGTLTRAFGIRFTSAEITGRVSKTGDFLVMQFTTSVGDRIEEQRLEVPLPHESAKGATQAKAEENPDEKFLAQIAEIDCMALKVVAEVSRDVAANYLHKSDEATTYDPGKGPRGKVDPCIQGDDVNLYSQVRKDRLAEPHMRVNALTGLSVHYQQTHQYYEALLQARGAVELASMTMPCEGDHASLSAGRRLACLFHRENKKNRIAQIAGWMQLGAAYSDYANVATSVSDRDKWRKLSKCAYETVQKIDSRYAPGANALGLQFSFDEDYEHAVLLYKDSLVSKESAAAHMDWGHCKNART